MEHRRVAWDVESYLARTRTACFVCELVAGTPGYEHEVVWRDDTGMAFLARYPVAWGHLLVVPIEHREHVVGDFDAAEYAQLQGLVHRAGTALPAIVPTERLYVLSLGSQQGNRHVHWHLVPLPPGVPYEEQQTALFDVERGWLEFDPGDLADLAGSLRRAMGS
jgi:diadenosine tetraphosphate (Ap4A) HIT family hydrolase